MKKEQKHIKLLRRWISGEITASEERELETAAEQDEAIRDAWAAYQTHAGADHKGRLAKLRGRLNKQQPKPVRRMMRPWMRIAAAVALLIVASWVVFQTQTVNEDALATNQSEASAEAEKDIPGTDEQQDVFASETTIETSSAKLETRAVEESVGRANSSSLPRASEQEVISIVATEDPATDSYETTAGASAFDSEELAQSNLNTFSISDDEADETVVLESEPRVKEEIVIATPPPPPFATPDVYRTQNQAAPSVRLEDRSAISNTGVRVPNAGFRLLKGYVTDEGGNPLIGASILEEGSANGTVADIDGYYELTVSEQSKTLQVNYTGFEAATVRIRKNDEINIVLEEGSQVLDEVVVTDLGTAYNRQSAEDDKAIVNARPEGGFGDLRRYLRDNTSENAGRANVKLRFYVRADGRPLNAEVISTTNPALNAEAIRLIEEGPSWIISAGEAPAEVIYTVKFR